MLQLGWYTVTSPVSQDREQSSEDCGQQTSHTLSLGQPGWVTSQSGQSFLLSKEAENLGSYKQPPSFFFFF